MLKRLKNKGKYGIYWKAFRTHQTLQRTSNLMVGTKSKKKKKNVKKEKTTQNPSHFFFSHIFCVLTLSSLLRCAMCTRYIYNWSQRVYVSFMCVFARYVFLSLAVALQTKHILAFSYIIYSIQKPNPLLWTCSEFAFKLTFRLAIFCVRVAVPLPPLQTNVLCVQWQCDRKQCLVLSHNGHNRFIYLILSHAHLWMVFCFFFSFPKINKYSGLENRQQLNRILFVHRTSNCSRPYVIWSTATVMAVNA